MTETSATQKIVLGMPSANSKFLSNQCVFLNNLSSEKKKKKTNNTRKKITFNSTLSKIISFMLSLLGAFEQVYKTKCKEGIKSAKKLSSLPPHTKEVNGSTHSVAKKMVKEEIIRFSFYTYIYTYIQTYMLDIFIKNIIFILILIYVN